MSILLASKNSDRDHIKLFITRLTITLAEQYKIPTSVLAFVGNRH